MAINKKTVKSSVKSSAESSEALKAPKIEAKAMEETQPKKAKKRGPKPSTTPTTGKTAKSKKAKTQSVAPKATKAKAAPKAKPEPEKPKGPDLTKVAIKATVGIWGKAAWSGLNFSPSGLPKPDVQLVLDVPLEVANGADIVRRDGNALLLTKKARRRLGKFIDQAALRIENTEERLKAADPEATLLFDVAPVTNSSSVRALISERATQLTQEEAMRDSI